MANITTYLKSKIAEQSLGKAPASTNLWHSQTWVGLFITSPNESYTPTSKSPGVEVTGSGYSRIQVSWDTGSSPYWVNTNGNVTNHGALTWNATGNWTGPGPSQSPSPITTVGIFTADWSGTGTDSSNLLWYGPLTAPVTMASGDIFSIADSGLVVTFT